MDDDDDDDSSGTPPEIEEQVDNVILNNVPNKSRKIYMKHYEQFLEWCKKQCGKPYVSDSMMIAYLNKLHRDGIKPSTLMTKLSGIRSIHNSKGKDLKFEKSFNFCKRMLKEYEPKKSRTLDKDQIENFLIEASDKEYLLHKLVSLIVLSVFSYS